MNGTTFSRWIVWYFCCMLGAWLMPPGVFAAEGPPAVFYVYIPIGGDTDLVQVDTEADTLTKVFSFGELVDPITLEEFSSVEWAAFQDHAEDVLGDKAAKSYEAARDRDVEVELGGLWEIEPEIFLLKHFVSECYGFPSESEEGDVQCYGGDQYSIFDMATQQRRVLWTLPDHVRGHSRDEHFCSRGGYPDDSDGILPRQPSVLLHPTRSLIAVTSWSFSDCPHALFLIDYTEEVATVTEVPDIISVAWSPDATQLAYVEQDKRSCQTEEDSLCAYRFGTLDLVTFEKAPVKEIQADGSLGYFAWIAWADSETLVFPLTMVDSGSFYHTDETATLTWYSLPDQQESTLSIPIWQRPLAIYTVQEGETLTLFAALGWYNNVGSGISTARIGLTPEFETIKGLPALDEGIYNSRSAPYVVGELYIGGMDGRPEITFIDADLRHFSIDMAPYAERYGSASSVYFAAVGVPRP